MRRSGEENFFSEEISKHTDYLASSFGEVKHCLDIALP